MSKHKRKRTAAKKQKRRKPRTCEILTIWGETCRECVSYVSEWCKVCRDNEFGDINSTALAEIRMGKIELPDSIKKGKKEGTVVTGYQGGGQQGGYQYKPCYHKGDDSVYTFSEGGKDLYAASSHGLEERSGKWQLIIDLAHVIKSSWTKKFVETAGKWAGLNNFVWKTAALPSEHLVLDWSDMQPPPVTLDFWLTLWELLPSKTVICCFGGHGRTGTCLASLMIADGVDYYQAVENVRVNHCKKAIETLGQETYLHKLYVEYLRRGIKLIDGKPEHAADLKDLQEDLKWALDHEPTQASSFGDKTKAPAAKVPAPGPALVAQNTKTAAKPDHELLGSKQIGGRTYYQCCVDPKCKDLSCEEPKHLGWVQFGGTGIPQFHD